MDRRLDEQEELSLYEQYLREMSGSPDELKQGVRQAEDRVNRAEDTQIWGKLARDMGLLAGGAIGGAIGGGGLDGVATGLSTVQPAMQQEFNTQGVERADRELERAERKRAEGMAASQGLRQMQREDVSDEREGQQFDQSMRKGEQSIQLNEMQIEQLATEMNDEQSLRDPNSAISQQYRDIAEAAGFDVLGDETAFELGQSFPMLTQAAQMDLQRQAHTLQQAQFAESKSQFDRQMQFSIDQANQQAMQQEMQRLQQMSAQEQEAEIMKWETAEKVVAPLERNPEFRANKEDLNNIIRLNALVEPSTNNVQVAMKLVQGYESLLRNSARPAEIAEATGRGVGWFQSKKEQIFDALGKGNVPNKVINEIRDALQIVGEGTAENINRIQEPYMEALRDRGIEPRYARQYFVTQETLAGVGGE